MADAGTELRREAVDGVPDHEHDHDHDDGAPPIRREPVRGGDTMTRPVPAPRDDLSVGEIADTSLVLDRVRGRAHLLNATAGWVWDLLDGSRTVPDVADVVATALAVDPAVVLDDVERTIASFEDAGLLGDPPAVAASPGATSVLGTVRSLPPGLGGPFEAIGTVFGVTAEPVELEAAVGPLLESLRPSAPPAPRGIAYSVHAPADPRREDARYEVHVGDDVLVRTEDLASALDQLLVEVNRRAIGEATGRLVFHAGAVELDGRGVILPANGGSGKSTLTAGLVAAGAGYGTDEAAVIDPATLQIEPYCKPLALSAASVDALIRWPDGPGADAFDRPVPDGSKRHVAPARLGRSMAGPTPLAAIVFPRYVGDGPTVIEPLDAEAALVALVPCTFAATWDVDDALAMMIAMVESTPAYRLDVGDLGDAVRLVGQVAASAGKGAP